MSLDTSLSIIHFTIGLMQFTAAAFAYLSDPKSTTNRIISILLVLLALTSVGVGFELNALTPGQALPWVALELFSVYAVSTVTFLIALMLFVPNVGNNRYVRIVSVGLIVIPLVLLMLDLIGESNRLFGFYFLMDVSAFFTKYTPGYIEIMEAADGPVHVAQFWTRNISYGVLMFYPLAFIVWRDRKSNPFNSSQALILLVATVVSAITNIFFLDLLPKTVPALISNIAFAAALALISVRNSELATSQSRTLDFFQNIKMFNKLLLVVMGIILPGIVLLSFTIYSFLIGNLLNSSSDYLFDFATSQAKLIADDLDHEVETLAEIADSYFVQDMLADNNSIYDAMTEAEIRNHLAEGETNEAHLDPTLRMGDNLQLNALIVGEEDLQTIFLVDQQGGLVVSSGIPVHYDYSKLKWWEIVMSENNPYVGSPQWDAEVESYVVQINFPIEDATGTQTGTLSGLYILENTFAALRDQANPDLRFGVTVNDVNLISSENTQEAIYQLPYWMADNEMNTRRWSVVSLDDEYSMLTSADFSSFESSFSADWQLSAYQTLESSLATLYSAGNSMVIVSAIILLLTAGASIFLARSISQPLGSLTEAAEQVLGGDLAVKIDISGEDELGMLATTFNRMTTELTDMVNTLESTVESRTEDLQQRSLQMETSALVARQAAEIHDLQTLLNQTVNLISEKFDFYHTGIFLLDSTNRYAVLQAASSPGGQRMLARGHRLQVGKVGVVGYCAGTGQPRISQDVGADIVYYDNPDMPGTRSEMALPLKVREAIIGVLDVQSTEASAFSQEDINVLQSLADQIALAIDNVRLLQNSQRALDELQRLYGQQAGQAWRLRLSGQDIGYQFTPTGIEPTKAGSRAALQNRPGHKLNKEITFRGQVIGNLNLIRETEDPNWTEEEQALVDDILEQTALALENARLVDQIRLRSDQIQLLQEISAISSEVLDEDKLLPILAEKLQSSLSVNHCGVVLLKDEKATLVSNAGLANGKPAIGTSLPIEEDLVTQRLVRNKEVDVLHNVPNDPRAKRFTSTFSIPGTKTLIFLPMVVRDQTAGYIYLDEISAERDIDAEEYTLFTQLSTQVSTALENIRLFDETVNRAERERQVAEITAKLRSSNDPKEILQTAVAELKKALNPASIQAEDQEEDQTSSPSAQANGNDVL
jgi:GAF domain-containing protein/HAMP domain-containing protein